MDGVSNLPFVRLWYLTSVSGSTTSGVYIHPDAETTSMNVICSHFPQTFASVLLTLEPTCKKYFDLPKVNPRIGSPDSPKVKIHDALIPYVWQIVCKRAKEVTTFAGYIDSALSCSRVTRVRSVSNGYIFKIDLIHSVPGTLFTNPSVSLHVILNIPINVCAISRRPCTFKGALLPWSSDNAYKIHFYLFSLNICFRPLRSTCSAMLLSVTCIRNTG